MTTQGKKGWIFSFCPNWQIKTDFIPHLLSVLHRRQTVIPRANVLSLSSDTTPSLCSLWCSTLLFNGRVDHTKVVNLWVVNKIYRMLQKQHQHIRWMVAECWQGWARVGVTNITFFSLSCQIPKCTHRDKYPSAPPVHLQQSHIHTKNHPSCLWYHQQKGTNVCISSVYNHKALGDPNGLVH